MRAEDGLLALAPSTAPRLRRRAAITLEWVEPDGLARVPARVECLGSLDETPLEVRLLASPVLIQRREHVRAGLELPVDAWSLLASTRLINGVTLVLSGGGALLRLTGVPAAASTLELRLALPDGAISTSARIVRHNDDGTVAVAFDAMRDQQERLVQLVFNRLRELTPTRHLKPT